ncbi:MAG: tyrosine-type recombinase/integrase [Actinobacteria bacterium]|nr:tyrosine-type recombinase/integrase [Actinomycetota bacterium]
MRAAATPRRARSSRADRRSSRGRGADRSSSRRGPGALGLRVLRRPAPRRAAGPPLERRRPRERADPGRAQHERPRRDWRAKEPRWSPRRAIVAALRDLVVEHKLVTRRDTGLVFGSSSSQPFTPTAVRKRALTAWRRVGLNAIGLHECRHTFASLLIAAGVNAKAITAYLGHASIQTTFDLYGHLMPGNEEEAVALVDAYLERADTRHRLVQLGTGE